MVLVIQGPYISQQLTGTTNNIRADAVTTRARATPPTPRHPAPPQNSSLQSVPSVNPTPPHPKIAVYRVYLQSIGKRAPPTLKPLSPRTPELDPQL